MKKEEISKLIGSIYINSANLEYIAETGKINGTLYGEIERVINEAIQALTKDSLTVGTADVKQKIAELIKSVNLNSANVEYILQTGIINGSLLHDLQRILQAMHTYAQQPSDADFEKFKGTPIDQLILDACNKSDSYQQILKLFKEYRQFCYNDYCKRNPF